MLAIIGNRGEGEGMKVKIEIDQTRKENEVIIKCKELDKDIQKIYDTIMGELKEPKHLVLKKDHTDYYLSLDEIVFFETSDNCISAHTINDIYLTAYKLYELEELLPGYFMRISKSTILNINHIYSITRNLTASSMVAFNGTHKQVYVSRHYYKVLKSRLNEKRVIT